MTTTITLPKFVGTRWFAEELCAEQLPATIHGAVTIDASDVSAAAPGFIDELVVQLVSVRGADHIRLVGYPKMLPALIGSAVARSLPIQIESAMEKAA